MKKIIGVIIFICVMFSSFAMAAGNSVDGKIGSARGNDIDKWGLMLNLAYFAELDPYFVLGIEPGLYWLKWDKSIGEETVGQFNVDVKADTNVYMFPVMLDAQIRLPNLEEEIYVVPHITVGLGYSCMIYDYSQPEYTDILSRRQPEKNDTDFYSGFSWQIAAGASIKPAPNSKIEFLAELGYRNAKLKRKNNEVDLSGFMFSLGVRYPLGGS